MKTPQPVLPYFTVLQFCIVPGCRINYVRWSMEVKFLVKSAHTKYVKFIRDIKQNICSAIVKTFFHFFYSALLAKGESKQKGWLESIALSMQSLLRWYQFWRQIIFKREEARLSSSLLNIICYQIWYQILTSTWIGH